MYFKKITFLLGIFLQPHDLFGYFYSPSCCMFLYVNNSNVFRFLFVSSAERKSCLKDLICLWKSMICTSELLLDNIDTVGFNSSTGISGAAVNPQTVQFPHTEL